MQLSLSCVLSECEDRELPPTALIQIPLSDSVSDTQFPTLAVTDGKVLARSFLAGDK